MTNDDEKDEGRFADVLAILESLVRCSKAEQTAMQDLGDGLLNF
jgi:hypothetical protein